MKLLHSHTIGTASRIAARVADIAWMGGGAAKVHQDIVFLGADMANLIAYVTKIMEEHGTTIEEAKAEAAKILARDSAEQPSVKPTAEGK